MVDAENKAALETADMWYQGYDERTNTAIKRAGITSGITSSSLSEKHTMVKIQKLQLPKFESSHKLYFKWKATFERYTKDFDYDTKYDYLYSYTEGKAHEYVSTKSTYQDAMNKLEEKYGNKHTIMKLLLDDIRSLKVVKIGYFTGFKNLSFQVSIFCDRLKEM